MPGEDCYCTAAEFDRAPLETDERYIVYDILSTYSSTTIRPRVYENAAELSYPRRWTTAV